MSTKKNAKNTKAAKKEVKKTETKGVKVKKAKQPVEVVVFENTDPEHEVKLDEPKAEKPVLSPEERKAKRNEYARAYYQANREKLCKASRECHKRSRVNAKEVGNLLAKIYDAFSGLVSEMEDPFHGMYEGGTAKLTEDFKTVLKHFGIKEA